MKVLILDSAPTPTTHSGKTVRLVNLFKRLGRRHELHFAGIVGPGQSDAVPEWLRALVASVRIWRRTEEESRWGRVANWLALQPWFTARRRYPQDYQRLSSRLRDLVHRERVDIIHSFDEEVAQFVPDDLPCAWVSDPADAMALHAERRAAQTIGWRKRWHWRSVAWRLDRYEHQLVRRASASVFVSPVDAARYLGNGTRERVQVIANGVDTEYFSPQSTVHSPRTPRLLFTGHMSFAPNHDAALSLIDDVLPLVRRQVPDVACYLVGAEPPDDLRARHDGRQVFVTGAVDDLRPYFRQASVFVCPMRLGAGIKNKLLEAMAMGCPVVTTRRGAEGLEVQDGVQLILADTPQAMSEAVVELLRQPARGDALRQAARAFVVAHHGWDRAAEAYDALYHQLQGVHP